MIDLTLNGFLHPDILGLSPQFGTIITRDAENKGGLSTAQTDTNMGLPFSLMRPVPVSSSDTTSQIEFDAKILITGNSEVTITLDRAVYEGCRLTITNRASESAIITGAKIEGVAGGRINIGINCVLELNYTESDGWIYSNSIVGEIRTLTETDAPAGWLICDGTEYDILQYPRLAPIMLNLPFNTDVTDGRFRVPDMRETNSFHGEMSDYEEFAVSRNNIVVPFNGIITYSLETTYTTKWYVDVNGVTVGYITNSTSETYLGAETSPIVVKKGDTIKVYDKLRPESTPYPAIKAYARWFKSTATDTTYIIKY